MKCAATILMLSATTSFLSPQSMGQDLLYKDIPLYFPSYVQVIESNLNKCALEIDNKETKEKRRQEKEEFKKNKKTGYLTARVNVRKKPSTDSKILDVYNVNKKISYVEENENWVKIRYNGKFAYIHSDYVSDQKINYISYDAPYNSGFKSYMDYKCITMTGSEQYKLQRDYAYTGNTGIRMIEGRYCAALGTGFNVSVGDHVDLVLENDTVIPIVIADIKDDNDTDSSNKITMHDGSMVEFIVSTSMLSSLTKRMGDISYAYTNWNSPVVEVKVYDRNYLN